MIACRSRGNDSCFGRCSTTLRSSRRLNQVKNVAKGMRLGKGVLALGKKTCIGVIWRGDKRNQRWLRVWSQIGWKSRQPLLLTTK